MHIVFGGAFNPPTKAHLNIIKKLMSTFEGSHVLLLPVGDDYKKPELIEFHHRLTMLKLMTSKMEQVTVSELESNRGYQGTLSILDALSYVYDNLHFVIGADNLYGFHKWIKYKELLSKYPFIIMTRKNGITEEEAEAMFKDIKHHFIFIEFDEDISSTDVRTNKTDQKNALTQEVYQYIRKNHLYEEPKNV
ncbi:MAG: nicotinate (nicotinamide) nucleotide adenylyltransferase [Tenericutes bacterium]|jgi:nicotinate-nucleotide adenylyltransferase|nr:nicotinate (nicotinamide) nucleotide adenylyltransferase [Mycoplasmatota bacterium]